MHIIKVNAIESTNSYLKNLSEKDRLEDFTIVIARHQTKGRGQMGTNWVSEKDKNLIFSIYKEFEFVPIAYQFFISMAVSLSILRTLETMLIKHLNIKWPNDILSDNKKIGGIIIENAIKQNQLKHSIIGVGLNVNQLYFKNLPQASSLALITGKQFAVDDILTEMIPNFQEYFTLLKEKQYDQIKEAYQNHLFRKDVNSNFENENGQTFEGTIQGVTDFGKLIIESNLGRKEYDLKEIRQIY